MFKPVVFFALILLLALIACQNRPLPTDTACTGLYQPVCGLDGKTYTNACEAQKAGQNYRSGECQDLSVNPIIQPI